MIKIIRDLFSYTEESAKVFNQKESVSTFEKAARQQFLELSEKGLGIEVTGY